MHALRRFIQQEMDERGWQARDLVKASGLSKQLVSNLLNDDRDVLPQMPRTSTLAALANAFGGLSVGHVTSIAVQALGVPDVQPPTVVHEISAASDDELLRELLARAERRGDGEHATSITRASADRRPLAAVQAELAAAEVTLAEWDKLEVSGKAADEKRAELQGHVDELKTEALSRHATGESRSVAKP